MNSDQVKSGVERAPHRSLLKADGYSDEQIRRPFVGVVNSFNEITDHCQGRQGRRSGGRRDSHGV